MAAGKAKTEEKELPKQIRKSKGRGPLSCVKVCLIIKIRKYFCVYKGMDFYML
jgi:hypothetical protein